MLFVLFVSSKLFSNNPSDTQVINVTIVKQNGFVITGPNPDFEINSLDLKPGKLTEITNDHTGFTVAIEDDSVKKIVGQLDGPMPGGTELYVYFSPLPSSKSTGFQKLSTAENDLVRNLTKDSTTYTPSTITYRFYFGRKAMDARSFSRKIIYTLMDQ